MKSAASLNDFERVFPPRSKQMIDLFDKADADVINLTRKYFVGPRAALLQEDAMRADHALLDSFRDQKMPRSQASVIYQLMAFAIFDGYLRPLIAIFEVIDRLMNGDFGMTPENELLRLAQFVQVRRDCYKLGQKALELPEPVDMTPLVDQWHYLLAECLTVRMWLVELIAKLDPKEISKACEQMAVSEKP